MSLTHSKETQEKLVKAAARVHNKFLMGEIVHGVHCDSKRNKPCDCGLDELFAALEMAHEET